MRRFAVALAFALAACSDPKSTTPEVPPECSVHADCDDGAYCNGAEECGSDGRCAPGTPAACDDGVACTADACDEALDGCTSTAQDAACAEGERCFPAGCAVPPECDDDTDCDDGAYCNGTETCDVGAGRCAAGTPVVCDDALVCTLDACDDSSDTCIHAYQPEQAGCPALAVSRAGTGGGTVTSEPEGISCGDVCSAWFEPGTVVTLSTAPDATSEHAGWSGDCSGTGPCVVTLDTARDVTASFNRVTHALAVIRTEGGSVSSTPAGVSCGDGCTASFTTGTTVTLDAAPAAGATFAGWSGACAGTGSCTLTMSAARSVGARFTYPLTVTRSGTGGGTVTSSPAALSCGSTCSAQVDGGNVVTLTAAPDATSTFDGWSGAGCTGTGTCDVTMDAAKTVTATFTRVTHAVTVSLAGSGGGSVSSTPAGISCGATCSASYGAGMVVTLTATGDATSDFAGWSGACAGSTATCSVTVDGAKAVTATFTRRYHALEVTASGPGSVASSPAGVDCGAACASGFQEGTVVRLTATPSSGASFIGWSGACTGAASTCDVTMTQARSVEARFGYVVAVTITGGGGGAVVSSPPGIACVGAIGCWNVYEPGTTVTLTAAPLTGNSVLSFSGCDSVSGNTCTVTAGQARSVTVTFGVPLTVTRTNGGGGTVTGDKIDCGSDCGETFAYGTTVVLTAAPDASVYLGSWTGCDSTSGAKCTVQLTGPKTVNARFAVGLELRPRGAGTVTRTPPGIVCPANTNCAGIVYDWGTTVTLTATPADGYAFIEWTGGGCSGAALTCNITMAQASVVTAQFTQ